MNSLAAVAALLMAAATPPQEDYGIKGHEYRPPSKGPGVPSDSKTPCCEDGRPNPWADYNLGVKWTVPLDAAVRKARESNKLLMIFHLVGDLDKQGC
jgi:hypothetical protein